MGFQGMCTVVDGLLQRVAADCNQQRRRGCVLYRYTSPNNDYIVKLLAVIRLNLPLQFNRQRLPFAINGLASGDANPAFADAVFLNVFAFFVVKANADIVFEHFGRMERAFGISGKMIGQGWFFSGFGHGRILK
jgi:hypothetical protein